MSTFWILIFSTMFLPGTHWATAQSLTESPVYQSDKELSVDIGDSATLQCCISENELGTIVWFKQPSRKKPRIIVTIYKYAGERFHNELGKSRFQIKRSSNCFIIIILNIIQTDEAMYYCAVMRPNILFADGTYLKIKGEHVTIALKTSKPARCNETMVCEPTRHGNKTNMNTQETTVLCLWTALVLCALLISCLTYSILGRRKHVKRQACVENSPGSRQQSEAEPLNYAAVQFIKRKPEKNKNECVYSDINKTV